LAGVVPATRGGPDLAAPHSARSTEMASMNAWSSAACVLDATRRDCRAASAMNFGDRVSGTQICIGRAPWQLKRSRWAWTFGRAATAFRRDDFRFDGDGILVTCNLPPPWRTTAFA